MKKLIDFIVEKRFKIALICLVLFTVLGVSGLSVGAIGNWILEPEKSNAIIGTDKYIKSDQYGVEIPFSIYQKNSGMEHFANINGITETDMNMSVHAPTFSLVTLFRIYNIGYWFLSSRMAMCFAWNLKIIAMLLATYELLRIITKDDRRLSFWGTILIGCSSFVNWWMAVDILVFGELLVISVEKFMSSKKPKEKIIWSAVFAYSAVAYVLTLYPAWIVSFGYIFLALIIWIVIKNWKNYKYDKFNKKIDIYCFIRNNCIYCCLWKFILCFIKRCNLQYFKYILSWS